jgi:hypothetical protein
MRGSPVVVVSRGILCMPEVPWFETERRLIRVFRKKEHRVWCIRKINRPQTPISRYRYHLGAMLSGLTVTNAVIG